MKRFIRKLYPALTIGFLIYFLAFPNTGKTQSLNFLHTKGNHILDSNGNQVLITGISWFGLETENYAPHGLWARNLESFLEQIVDLGFNTIRLPYSNQLFDPSSLPSGIDYDINPDLIGLNGLEIMDKVIAGAGERGLKVILDRHRPDSRSQSELWYTSQYSEERWINDWVMLSDRYSGDDTVIGVDLHNEPHGRATWGSGEHDTDWRLAAERAGNAILEVNPNLLILVQGVEQYQGEYYWWGGNLKGVRQYPVRLNHPAQLVYSPHTYGPGVYPQSWFSDPSFPDNMPEIWNNHWAYIHNEGIAPIILGEFGGRSVEGSKEGIWQQTLVSYLRQKNISYLYWTLNPNSGDTGGILLDDWQTIDPEKRELLSSFQFPLIDSGEAVIGTITPPTTATNTPTPANSQTSLTTPTVQYNSLDINVRFRTANPAEVTNDSKLEFILANNTSQAIPLQQVELAYWFTDDPGLSFDFHCDWAQIGCENITGEFADLSGNEYALIIRFKSAQADLLPGQESGEIKLRFNRSDWTEFNQSDDYSFIMSSDYIKWEKIGLYLNDQLVWGSEPDTNIPTPTVVKPSATQISYLATAISTQATMTPSQNYSKFNLNPVEWVLIMTVIIITAVSFLLFARWLIKLVR